MTWDTIVSLILKVGLEQAYRIWQIAKAGEPDEEAWAKLKALSLKSYDDYVAEARSRADATKPDV